MKIFGNKSKKEQHRRLIAELTRQFNTNPNGAADYKRVLIWQCLDTRNKYKLVKQGDELTNKDITKIDSICKSLSLKCIYHDDTGEFRILYAPLAFLYPAGVTKK